MGSLYDSLIFLSVSVAIASGASFALAGCGCSDTNSNKTETVKDAVVLPEDVTAVSLSGDAAVVSTADAVTGTD